jgi:nucleoside-diphosphate-sugar epimerase
MKLLVLGGTRFLGRHIVDAALARGDDVTIFTRGRLPVPWRSAADEAGASLPPPQPRENDGDVRGRVTALVGDRDPRIAPGLRALESGAWDAVVDCSGYVPRAVEASARLLSRRVSRYIFVSSMSVYAKTERPGMDEDTPVATLDDAATEQVMEHYGALKAACERVVDRFYGRRATQVRPGLIVGPFDATDRFGYWVARFVHPRLLGARPARAVVPAPPARPIQFIDARDLAAWLLEIAHRDVAGVFNACSAAFQWRFGDLVDALVAAAPAPPEPAWIDDDRLLARGVTPWVGLPLWLPASDADSGGFMAMNCARAHGAGLAIRPLAETIAATGAWLAARDNAGAWKHVLSAETERGLLQG